jgi:hypothetical protein
MKKRASEERKLEGEVEKAETQSWFLHFSRKIKREEPKKVFAPPPPELSFQNSFLR